MTEQKFRKRMFLRLGLSVVLLLTGIVLLLYTVIQQGGFIPDSAYYHQDLTHSGFTVRGYYYGISLGLTFSALITLIKTAILLKKEDKFRKQYVEETDERNIEIIRRAKSISWYATAYLVLVATFFLPSDIVAALIGVIFTLNFIYMISYWVLQKNA